MGFRSYVRQFFRRLFCAFSVHFLPWCFRSYVRQWFCAAFFAPSPSFTAMRVSLSGGLWFCSGQKSSFSMGFRSYVRQFFERDKFCSEIRSFSMGFRSYVREFFAAFLCAFSVLHCHGVSLSGGCGFARSFLAQEPRFGAGQVA